MPNPEHVSLVIGAALAAAGTLALFLVFAGWGYAIFVGRELEKVRREANARHTDLVRRLHAARVEGRLLMADAEERREGLACAVYQIIARLDELKPVPRYSGPLRSCRGEAVADNH